jgi:citrate lyase subunit beta / citryl-CoA lyase
MIPRSFLFAPADSEKKIAKALDSSTDAVILDLEDSVAPTNKAAARSLAAETLSRTLSGAGRQGKSLWVRINPLDGPLAQASLALADLAATVAGRPDGIILPKCEGPEHLRRLSHHLEALETQAGLELGRIRILPLVTETPKALFTTGAYGGVTARLAGLTWGAEDLSAALGASSNRDPDGGFTFTCKMARSLCLAGAHAAEVAAVETVYTDFRDLEGLAAYARAGRREGFSGMLAIHPDQVAVINAAFTPSPEEIAQARRIVEAFAQAPNAGVVSLDGKMVDLPHLKQARRVLEAAARFGLK